MQEMFRFDAFHMYGVIATAVATAALSLLAIRRLSLHDADGAPLCLAPKPVGRGIRYVVGGTLFGVGMGPDRRVPGTAGGAGRRRCAGDDRRDRRGAGGDVDLRLSAPSAAASILLSG
jgi:hypothetical protein